MTKFQSPQEKLKQWASEKTEAIFLKQPWSGSSRYTNWQDVLFETQKIAGFLSKFPKGTRIGIFSLNCDSWIKADLAIMAAGHISVPIYPTASMQTVEKIVKHAEIQLLFVGKLFDPLPIDSLDLALERVAIFNHNSDYQHWDDIVNSDVKPVDLHMPQPKEIATIVYTSGTTGNPKGVVTSYNALSEAFKSIAKTLALTESERFFSYLPLAHVAERVAVEMGAVFYGCEISFVGSLDTFAVDLQRAKPTVFFGVPRIWLKLKLSIESKLGGEAFSRWLLNLPWLGQKLKKAIVVKLGLDQAWLCLSGAASISPTTLNWFESLGIVINEVYGMSETLGLATANTPNNRKVGTVGQPVSGCQLIIADNGEILLNTPTLMDGYYLEKELTAASLQGEWFRTGDLGEIDEQGFVKITGRAKDLFKTSKGKYVSPIMIEDEIASTFNLEQVCVMGNGLPQPVVLIVDESASVVHSKELIKHYIEKLELVNSRLEKHEKVTLIGVTTKPWTVENQMLTPTLKIRRQVIEENYQQQMIEKAQGIKQKVIFV